MGLDIIMNREIRYYLDRDMRIYNRIEPNYEAMEVSVNTIDSVLLRITSVHDLMKNTPGDSLQSVPEDSSLSYSAMIKSSSKDIALAIKAYNKGLKKLKRGFRKDRKKLVFIKDEYQQFKNTLYEIKYKRDLLQSDLSDFDKKLNEALFKENGTIYSKRVIKTSKQLERLKSRLDSFEQFLVGIELEGHTQLTSILKLRDSDEWTVRYGNQINIDPEINLDWISLIVSPLGRNNNNWDWTIRISDGFSEDFTLFSPYPNPSIGELVSIDMQVISSQTITTRIFDLGGREIWSKIEEFNSPSLKTVQWNGINHNGNKVSNGIYFIVAEGINQTDSKKIIYLKKN